MPDTAQAILQSILKRDGAPSSRMNGPHLAAGQEAPALRAEDEAVLQLRLLLRLQALLLVTPSLKAWIILH